MEVGSETCQQLCPHHQLQYQLQQRRRPVTHALEDQKKVKEVSEHMNSYSTRDKIPRRNMEVSVTVLNA
ncbi:hypothetical protein AOLI_G00056870 [Acnodon oligacanthus]